jgi:hypothetical protein
MQTILYNTAINVYVCSGGKQLQFMDRMFACTQGAGDACMLISGLLGGPHLSSTQVKSAAHLIAAQGEVLQLGQSGPLIFKLAAGKRVPADASGALHPAKF